MTHLTGRSDGYLYVGPWQEFALSKLLAQSRGHAAIPHVLEDRPEVHIYPEATANIRRELGEMRLRALKERAREVGVDAVTLYSLDDAEDPKAAAIDAIVTASARRPSNGPEAEIRIGTASSQALSSVGSVYGAASSRSSQSSKTDPTSWHSSGARSDQTRPDQMTALFRRARNLKYKGHQYARPWRAEGRREAGLKAARLRAAGLTKQQNVERLKSMYGLENNSRARTQDEFDRVSQCTAQISVQVASAKRKPANGRRAGGGEPLCPSPPPPPPLSLPVGSTWATTHGAAGSGKASPQPECQMNVARAALGWRTPPRSPTGIVSPRFGEGDVDDLLLWAVGVTMHLCIDQCTCTAAILRIDLDAPLLLQ